MIASDQDLVRTCEAFAASPFLCIDTEFHRETTYYSKLALIQMADAHTTVVVDVLAIDNLDPIKALLQNTAITKVFHAAYQDIEIFLHDLDCVPDPVFDTQVAAPLMGMNDQIGYGGLIKELLQVELDKSQSRTDWLQRPLSPKQIEYAAHDVYYLAQAYVLLTEKLTELGRLDWLAEEFRELANPDTYVTTDADMWKKIKGVNKLHGQQLAILQAITAWRETTAKQRNKPRRRIVADDVLTDIARQRCDSAEKILALRSLRNSRFNRHDAEALAAAAKQGLSLSKADWPRLPAFTRTTVEQDALVDLLSALIKYYAHEHGINPLVIASRKHLEALVTGNTDIPLMHGWRKHHAGEQCEAFLHGRFSLQVSNGRLHMHELSQ